MANDRSALKRIRHNKVTRMANRYYKKSTRTAIQKLRGITESTEAIKLLPRVISMIDRLAKKNTWHKNKASNLKSSLTKQVAKIA
ncbi:MAG: 30S ribosomal protein S20 [Saprospiraceae bacterium]|nr:30S ribosomal protein S20 [Saprospiraceae bacterium]